jgi:hypothetical protein
MDRFVLVDLRIQLDAVAEHIKGWDMQQVLDWMRQHGKVTESLSPYGKIYVFKSPCGAKSGFYFTPAGRLKVISAGWLPC